MKIFLVLVSFFVSGSPAPHGPVSSPPTVQSATLSQVDLAFSTLPTLQPTSESHKESAKSLTDTIIVIIVSVSLALLVCAIIPLIFYGHWRSSGEESIHNNAGGNTYVAEYIDEHTDIPLVQSSVALQTDLETEAPDLANYASTYQALDPQSLD
uniref:Uncharacterized protein n=1 Tax=Knipowitschia caucasica TaxID=637954 RepID=A0AAV2LHH6_KNICA